MDPNVTDYINSLLGQFAVPRKLTDGTLVTGFVPDEELAIMQFIGAFTRQRRGGGRLAAFVEFSPEANPYTTIMLGWWGLLAADANATNKALLWVTTTGTMEAKAEMHAVRRCRNPGCCTKSLSSATWISSQATTCFGCSAAMAPSDTMRC